MKFVLVAIALMVVLLLSSCNLPSCAKYGPAYTAYAQHTQCLYYKRKGGCGAYLITYSPYQTRDCLEWKN